MNRVETSPWSAALSRAVSRAVAWSVDPNGMLDAEPPSAALASLAVAVLDVAEGRPVPQLGGMPWISRFSQLARRLRHAILAERGSGFLTDGQALHLVESLSQVEMAHATDVAVQFGDQLETASAMDLLVEVAHDMRSPIGAMLLLVDRMRRGHAGPVTAVQERQLGLVHAAAFGLGSLAGDVMELARGGAALVGEQPVPFSLREVLRAMLDVVQPIAEEKGLRIHADGPTDDRRLGHPAALYRILLNLATNALKFTSNGEVTLIAREVDGDHVEFIVRDTGRGIPPATLQSLQAVLHGHDRPVAHALSSTGLGLAICRKLVARMDGTLSVESSPDSGTSVSFTLALPPAPLH